MREEITTRFDALEKGQKSHRKELEAVRDMLVDDTGSYDEIDRMVGRIERLERKVKKLEKA